MSQETPKKEVYGDPIKFRLGAEFWRITDYLMPKIYVGVDFLAENKLIDAEWVDTLKQVGILTLEAKHAIFGFRSLLTKEDAGAIRPFEECLAVALSRPERAKIASRVMDGRAELYARRRLQLEDRALALSLQALDMRAVAYKNKMWAFGNAPNPGMPQM